MRRTTTYRGRPMSGAWQRNVGCLHSCPVPGCTRGRAAHHVMCGTHWQAVHPGMRQAVYAAWGGYCRGKVALEDYLQVRERAVQALRRPRDVFQRRRRT